MQCLFDLHIFHVQAYLWYVVKQRRAEFDIAAGQLFDLFDHVYDIAAVRANRYFLLRMAIGRQALQEDPRQ